MYLRILIITILLLLSNKLISQANYFIHVSSGFSLFLVNDTNDKSLSMIKPQQTFGGGFNIEKNLGQKSLLLLGFEYSEKGARGGDKGIFRIVEGLVKSYYLDIPILFGYRINKKYCVFAGFNNSIIMESEVRLNRYAQYNMDLRLGINYNFYKRISLVSIYDIGLTPVIFRNGTNLYNQRLLFGISYKLNRKK